MTTDELFTLLLRFDTCALEEVCREFECPEWDFSRTSLMAWCRLQGQRDHLETRVLQIIDWSGE